MRNVKSLIHLTANHRSNEDPDELQSLDESDSRWVEAWKNAVKQLTELPVPVIHQLKRAGV